MTSVVHRQGLGIEWVVEGGLMLDCGHRGSGVLVLGRGFGISNNPSLSQVLREFPWLLWLRTGFWLGGGKGYISTRHDIHSLSILDMMVILVELLSSSKLILPG